jgi:hypothetical protein
MLPSAFNSSAEAKTQTGCRRRKATTALAVPTEKTTQKASQITLGY